MTVWWLLGGLGICLAAWSLESARRVLNPDRRHISPPDSFPAYTVHPIVARDGSRFDVWVLETAAPRARLLLIHGYYANRHQVLDLAGGLRARGYEILLFELRGHGERPGPCTMGIRETTDAQAVLEWAAHRRDLERALPVGLLGLSMGAAVACQLAARERAVHAVVVDSIYSRLFPVLARSLWQRYHLPAIPWAWLTWWSLQLSLRRRLAPLDPAVLAYRCRQPLLAIQGGEDRRVVPLLGREFYRCWAGPKERWFEERIAHVGMFARHPQEYCNRVADFFDRTLRT
ncbi:MAG: alpha/beta fold hydrolase [Candidatus Omnitrophica bacterium]|nr:alpha/beta fold hydrolase [Candidatus Omnitrophota bacterium]